MSEVDTEQDKNGDERANLREALLRHPTGPIPDVGWAFLGLGRNASYAAAKRGDIPTLDIGGRKLAMVAPLAEKLGLRTTFGRAV